MINLNKFDIKGLPAGYTLESSEWYQELSKTEQEQSRKNSIFFQGILILIFLSFTIFNVLNYSLEHVILYASILGVIGLTFIYTLIKKNLSWVPEILFLSLAIGGAGIVIASEKNIPIMHSFYFIQALILLAFILPKRFMTVIYMCESIGIYVYTTIQNDTLEYANQIEILIPIIIILTLLILNNREKRQKLLIENIVFDKITGLPKREILLKTKIQNENLLCLIKVSNFRDLLNNFGYDLAEDIFLFASKQIKKISEKNNYRAYKLLGNEYAILLPLDQDLDEEGIKKKIEQIIYKMESEKMKWRGAEISLLYNFGASLIQAHEDTINLGISKADAALKEGAKKTAKIVIYNEALHKYLNPIESIIKFTTLIENKEDNKFEAVFEKMDGLENKKEKIYQCQIKIKGRDGKLKPISEYQEISAATGLYKDITNFALEKTLAFAKENKQNVLVNITSKDIVDKEVVENIKAKKNKIEQLKLKMYLQLNEKGNKDYSESIQKFIKKVGLAEERIFQNRE